MYLKLRCHLGVNSGFNKRRWCIYISIPVSDEAFEGNSGVVNRIHIKYFVIINNDLTVVNVSFFVTDEAFEGNSGVVNRIH